MVDYRARAGGGGGAGRSSLYGLTLHELVKLIIELEERLTKIEEILNDKS